MNSHFVTRSARALLAAGIGLGATLGNRGAGAGRPRPVRPQAHADDDPHRECGHFYEHHSSTVTVRLSNPSCTTVSVDFSTPADTATPYLDYIPASLTMVFNPGDTVKFVTIYGVDDKVQEGEKWFSVNLTSVKGATLTSPSLYLAVDGVEPR